MRILYVSPLKALNQDVCAKLAVSAAGILARSKAIGSPLPALRVAVRSGDTPAHERAAIVRKPPDILITTPESLHLMLTSRAREMLRGISHVIVDEIHAVCGNKRGAFLALLLERLQAIADRPFRPDRPVGDPAAARRGRALSRGASSGPASASPAHEPCRGRSRSSTPAGAATWICRSIWPRTPERPAVAGSIWPEIERELLSLVRQHRSTIIFANNRRTVEKLTARLNELAEPDDAISQSREPGPGDEARPRPTGPFRAHHGSISLEERRATEAGTQAR